MVVAQLDHEQGKPVRRRATEVPGDCYGTFKTFKCGRKATGYVRTNVGFSRTHYVCDDPECFQSVTGGHPATFTPLKKE